MEGFEFVWKGSKLLNYAITLKLRLWLLIILSMFKSFWQKGNHLEKKEYLDYCFLQTAYRCFLQISGQLMNVFDSMRMELKISNIPASLLN